MVLVSRESRAAGARGTARHDHCLEPAHHSDGHDLRPPRSARPTDASSRRAAESFRLAKSLDGTGLDAPAGRGGFRPGEPDAVGSALGAAGNHGCQARMADERSTAHRSRLISRPAGLVLRNSGMEATGYRCCPAAFAGRADGQAFPGLLHGRGHGVRCVPRPPKRASRPRRSQGRVSLRGRRRWSGRAGCVSGKLNRCRKPVGSDVQSKSGAEDLRSRVRLAFLPRSGALRPETVAEDAHRMEPGARGTTARPARWPACPAGRSRRSGGFAPDPFGALRHRPSA